MLMYDFHYNSVRKQFGLKQNCAICMQTASYTLSAGSCLLFITFQSEVNTCLTLAANHWIIQTIPH